MTRPGPFDVTSRTFNSPSGALTAQVVSAFALAMVASVNATVRKIYFMLVLHFVWQAHQCGLPKASSPSHRGAALLIAFRLLVVLLPVRDLLLVAKQLFVAAIAGGDAARLAAVRSAAQVR